MRQSRPVENRDHAPEGTRVAIVCSRYNGELVSELLASCKKALSDRAVEGSCVTVTAVPGAFELPFAALTLARTGHYTAVICLGAVIRGETPHFEYVSQSAALGILQAGLAACIPIIFGVLTCDTVEQALARIGQEAPAGDKGYEAGMSAVDMILWQTEVVRHG